MSPIDKTPSGNPLEPNPRLEALKKIIDQREQLQGTPLPAPVKQVRDAFLLNTRTDPENWNVGLGDLGVIKLPPSLDARPMYGLSPVPLPAPPWGKEPHPIEARPKYGLSPLPEGLTETRPTVGLPVTWPGPDEREEEPQPIEARPKYGLSPLPRDE